MSTLTGGKKLQAKLAEIAKGLEGKHTLRVGFLEGSEYLDEGDVTAAQTAWWLNFGTKTSPPRPFFTNMVAEKSDAWGDKLARILAHNGYDVEAALQPMGEGISDQLRDAIFNIAGPSLSPVTLMLRKMRMDDPHLVVTGATVGEAARRVAAGESSEGASTAIGVYTGHMSNSVDYEVTSEP